MLLDVLPRPARQCVYQLQNERGMVVYQFVLLTKATLLLSGDQEGTLTVPCPPYTYAITFGWPPPMGMSLR